MKMHEDAFNPIIIKIQNKRHIIHPPLRRLLLPIDIQVPEPSAGSVKIVDRNANMLPPPF